MTAYVDSVEFVTHTCGGCGVLFGMTREFHDQRKRDRKGWSCVNGCSRVFTGPSEADKLRDEVERQRQVAEAEGARAARLENERDQVARAHTKMRARVMNGVCPCCNRTFQNLLQHMKTEHAGEVSLSTLRQTFGMTQTAVAKEIGITPVYVSLHERGKPVPAYAARAIDGWVARQASGKLPA